MSGTVYVGDKIIDGAIDVIDKLRLKKKNSLQNYNIKQVQNQAIYKCIKNFILSLKFVIKLIFLKNHIKIKNRVKISIKLLNCNTYGIIN